MCVLKTMRFLDKLHNTVRFHIAIKNNHMIMDYSKLNVKEWLEGDFAKENDLLIIKTSSANIGLQQKREKQAHMRSYFLDTSVRVSNRS